MAHTDADYHYLVIIGEEIYDYGKYIAEKFKHDPEYRENCKAIYIEGLEEKSREIARKLLLKGLDSKEIADLTGLTIDEIKGLDGVNNDKTRKR